MPKCKHGMELAYCSLCVPVQRPVSPYINRTPKKRKVPTDHGAAALSVNDFFPHSFVLIHTAGGRTHSTFSLLNERTSTVHIDGHPFVWAIELILERAPNLKTIQLTPRNTRNIKKSHRDLAEARGVRIVSGFARPDLAWDEHENRSPFYGAQREFLLRLEGEQKALWEELILFGFEQAQLMVYNYSHLYSFC